VVPVAPVAAPVAPALPPHDPVTGEVTEAAPAKREYKKRVAPAPAPVAPPAPVVEEEMGNGSDIEDELDAQLNDLLN
jgi:hypothetical protein